MSNKLWFKRRRYGWGWTPVTWQGWLTLAIFLIVVLCAGALLPMKPADPSVFELVLFFMVTVSAVFLLIGTTLAKGPLPRWRWGKKSSDNPDEDF